jgi:hypothetical protein
VVGDATASSFESGILVSAADVCITFPEESMILIGTRLRGGAAVGSNDAWTNDAGLFDFWKCDMSLRKPHIS